MAFCIISSDRLTAIADAVRAQTGITGQMSIQEIIEAIGTTGADAMFDGIVDRTLTHINSDTVEAVAAYAFYNNTTINSVNVPAATSIGEYAFAGCTGITTIVTNASSIGYAAFDGCSSLSNISFGNLSGGLGVAAFRGCEEIQSLDFRDTSLSQITVNAFSNSGLNDLWLPRSTFCMLISSNAFSGTAFASNGSGGTLHIPQNLRVRYEAGTNWAGIIGNGSNRILSY